MVSARLLDPDEYAGNEEIGFQVNLHILIRYYNSVNTYVDNQRIRVRRKNRTMENVYGMLSPYLTPKMRETVNPMRKKIRGMGFRVRGEQKDELEDLLDEYYIMLMKVMAEKGLLMQESIRIEPPEDE